MGIANPLARTADINDVTEVASGQNHVIAPKSDGDVDQSDFASLQRCLTEPDVVANPACAN